MTAKLTNIASSTEAWEARVEKALRHCGPDCTQAVLRFRRERNAANLRLALAGLLSPFVAQVDPVFLFDEHRSLGLADDLGVDSLSMMEFSLLSEDAFDINLRYDGISQARDTESLLRYLAGELSVELPRPRPVGDKTAGPAMPLLGSLPLSAK